MKGVSYRTVPVLVIVSLCGTRDTAAIHVEYDLLHSLFYWLALVEGTASAVLTLANSLGTRVGRKLNNTLWKGSRVDQESATRVMIGASVLCSPCSCFYCFYARSYLPCFSLYDFRVVLAAVSPHCFGVTTVLCLG